ncbi:MAG TPA: zinc ribbon domain-containing protein, partial [Chloroflexia bacterium]
MAIRCQNCGNMNPDDYAFCDECGARLTADTSSAAAAPMGGEPAATPVAATAGAGTMTGGTVRCTNCGAENVAGAAFCDECGAALPQPTVEDTTVTSPPPPAYGAPAAPYMPVTDTTTTTTEAT